MAGLILYDQSHDPSVCHLRSISENPNKSYVEYGRDFGKCRVDSNVAGIVWG